MSMRASVSDLPIVLEEVSFASGGVTILDHISLAFATRAPAVLIGPNGAGKTTLLRLLMGLIAPVRGRVTWGGREDVEPTHRAIVFQRPVMLRRSAAGNIRYALAAAGVPRGERIALCARRPERARPPTGAQALRRRAAAAGARARSRQGTANPAARRADRKPRSRRD